MERHVTRGLPWVGLASSLVGALDAAAYIIVIAAGWVSVEQYGIAALATSVTAILDYATDLGLGAAVIQRDDVTPAKVSTVFWLNLAMSLVLFGLLAVGAPVYAGVFRHPVVGSLLIAYGAKLILQNVYAMPAALMKREFRFRELSIVRILANVTEFGFKVGFAAAGFPIWCWVLGPLARTLVYCVGVQVCRPWRPALVLRLREAAAYARFGLKTSASQILFYFYTNIDYQVVAFGFGATALGLYKIAYELVLEPVRIMSNVIVEVALPAFARLKYKRAQLTEQFIAFTRQNLVVIVPFVVLILLGAQEILSVIKPDLVAAAPAARILCIVGLFRALSFVAPPLLDGIGYPSRTLAYTVVAAVVLPISYVVFAAYLGPELDYLSVAVAWAVGYPIAFLVVTALALHHLGLPLLAYLRRTMGIPACAVPAAAAGLAVRLATPGWPAFPRLLAIAVVTLGAMSVLLAYLQGISPRTVLAAVRGKGAAAPPRPGEPPAAVAVAGGEARPGPRVAGGGQAGDLPGA